MFPADEDYKCRSTCPEECGIYLIVYSKIKAKKTFYSACVGLYVHAHVQHKIHISILGK